jgi:hypothetical protein
MLPLAGNEKFRVRVRGRVRVRSKNENDSGGPRERKPRPRRGSFLVARNRSSIVLVLVLVLVSAIGCKGEDVGVPKSNKLALTGFQPWEALSKRICPEGARDHGPTDGWHYACDLEPLQGSSQRRLRFPGLKPWAESYSPFGAPVAGTMINI